MNALRDRVAALVELYREDVAPIVSLGDPVLRQVAEPYDGQLDDALLREFIVVMRRTMQRAPGVGLAAPQIGIGLQIAVLEDPAPVPPEVAESRQRYPLEFFTAINPAYTATGPDTATFYEGCLSMPGYTAVVERSLSVAGEYSDPAGARQQVEFTGWQARIFQHETDHLHGMVYVDKMDPRSLSTTENYLRR